MGVYDFAVRILTCPACGAPLDVPPGGGQANCNYCGQASMFSPRPAASAPHAAPAAEDPARIERLRAQTSSQDQPPAELIPFLATALSGQRLEEAEAKIRQLRGAPKSDARDQRIHWLTLALYNAYTGPENALRQRALIESASETVSGSARTSVLMGMLARNAARAGEVGAAQTWISQIDPNSESLMADSAYRLSRAYVATASGDFQSVLRMLGSDVVSVPLAPGDRLMSVVLRSNAHERLGESPTGAAQLAAFMQQDPAFGPLLLRIIAANPTLELCPEAIQLATTVVERQG